MAAIDQTLVYAPFDGTVAEINAELGEYVTPSPPGIPTLPAIDLLDVSCLYVSAPIDEVDAAQLEIGMTACVSLDAFEQPRCSGKVSRIAPYVLEKEKQARTIEVEVKLSEEEDLNNLLPGYSADIEVFIQISTFKLSISFNKSLVIVFQCLVIITIGFFACDIILQIFTVCSQFSEGSPISPILTKGISIFIIFLIILF